ncbi:hypothetical protein Nepgr_023766 [Nepenthes gracilis]|uniref:X8 domain-containing protein n=1 Tax=Nepenthes gracilis TaxID=150966 RepID=A0AAD3T2Q7_NEPGR|nr:hypothetical protein Nepgr_023766 [Nepenthes gracilis]
MAARALTVLFFLAMAGHSSGSWCVCKDGLSDAVLQKTLDYACGAGADCSPIKQNGACFNPSTVKAHCSYAVNSYFQRKNEAGGTCDFAGTATVSASDPSYSGCVFPASASAAGTSTTPVTVPSTTPTTPITGTPATTTPTTPVTGTPATTTPTTPVTGTPATTTSPYGATPTTVTPSGATPSTGILGGVGTGLGPSGMNDDSRAPITLHSASSISLVASLLFSGLMFLLWS